VHITSAPKIDELDAHAKGHEKTVVPAGWERQAPPAGHVKFPWSITRHG
jgi:hypothetical protein